MKCKNYRIVKWLNGTRIVYTPQIKAFSIWWDMKTPNRAFLEMHGVRGHVTSEKEAKEIIEDYIQREKNSLEFKKECQLAQKEFEKEKDKIICVE